MYENEFEYLKLEFVLIEESKGKYIFASSTSMFIANFNGGYALDHPKKRGRKQMRLYNF